MSRHVGVVFRNIYKLQICNFENNIRPYVPRDAQPETEEDLGVELYSRH